MDRRDWSIVRLARETGVTASWASRMLRRFAWADLDAVIRIERVLQIGFFPEDKA